MPRAWVTSPEYDRLVRLLIDARVRAGLSQRTMAERLAKPRSYVSKVETKERRLDVLEFIEWANAAGADPSDLFGTILEQPRHT